MTALQIIILSVSISFCVTQVWKPVNVKPFNCMICLTGWVAAIIAGYTPYGWYCILFFPVGCFAGAMVEAFIMRWL